MSKKEDLKRLNEFDNVLIWYDREIQKLEERRELVYQEWKKLAKEIQEIND